MANLGQKIEQITQVFLSLPDWESRYREIISKGKSLNLLEDEFKVEKFRIKGCQSQVWLVPEYKDKKVYFRADSDSVLVKGIIALLVEVYSGETPDNIITTPPDFLKTIGLMENLTMNRANGLSNMIKQLKLYAVAFKAMEK